MPRASTRSTSSSAQNVSTVTLNLRLDADADRAVVRRALQSQPGPQAYLPREANDPIVTRTTGEGYRPDVHRLQFEADDVFADQRLSQPGHPAEAAVDQRRRQCGNTRRPDLRHAHLARSRPHGGLRRDAARRQPRRWPANNFTTAAGEIKGDYVQTNINAQTSLERRAGVREPRRGRAAATTLIRLGQIARIELGPENFNSSSVLRRAEGGVHRRLYDAFGQPAHRHRRRARGHAGNPGAAADRARGGDRL